LAKISGGNEKKKKKRRKKDSRRTLKQSAEMHEVGERMVRKRNPKKRGRVAGTSLTTGQLRHGTDKGMKIVCGPQSANS